MSSCLVLTAYHALVENLAEHGLLSAIDSAWFVELCPDLAAATARYWDRNAAQRGVPPCKRAGYDVWSLLRDNASHLRRLCTGFPEGALVLIVGGPPCLNLTSYSQGKGALGLCGPYSFNLFSIPLIAWTVQECRPDTVVHALVENAGSIQQLHLNFLARFLATGVSSHIPHYDPVGRGEPAPLELRRQKPHFRFHTP